MMERARRHFHWITALLAAVLLPSGLAGAGNHVFTVRDEKTCLNGHEILVKGLRCSNALISDQKTGELIDNLGTFAEYGVNTDAMKAEQIRQTKAHLARGEGYMLASTWLQCVSPHGPNHTPGGKGTQADPGIQWWLEFLRDTYGPYTPSR